VSRSDVKMANEGTVGKDPPIFNLGAQWVERKREQLDTKEGEIADKME
jgi:hypothetical protein